jgi:hypothetical protein
MSEKPHNTGKRIVSKSAYAVLFSKREAKRWGSFVLAAATGVCGVFSIVCFYGMLSGIGYHDYFWMLLGAAGCCASVAAACTLMRFAGRMMQQVQLNLDVVPLTRANVGDMPAPDILLRASILSPTQQQVELLRAAQYGKESPSEELLRAGEESRLDV